MSHRLRLFRSIVVVAAAATGVSIGACRKRHQPAAPPLATPQIVLSHTSAPLGSPIDITYRFVVAPDAHFSRDYRVMVHVLDADDELMWTDDHNPPTPTTQWTPGRTIEYTRTIFVPVYPYIGRATIQMGLYSTADQSRAPLAGQDNGQRAYTVARLELEPQTANLPTVFKEGWHPVEVAEHNATVEWQWTKKDATIVFKNPKKDCIFYLDADNPSVAFNQPQHVRVVFANGAVADDFTIQPKEEVLRKIHLASAQLGAGDTVELHIVVDKTFVPALLNAAVNKDPRELGIRVFHAVVDPR